MRIAFVYPDIGGAEQYGTRKFYHGVGYLSAVLKAAGHETTLAYLQAVPDRNSFLTRINRLSPDLVAFSSTTHQHRFVELGAAWLKAVQPGIFTLSGGIHPTLQPEEVIKNENLDAVCVGEGEQPLLELVEALEAGQKIIGIANLWLKQGDRIIRNPLRPLITDLDQLPFADRGLFDYQDILAHNGGIVDLMAGRGCPYRCSYCCNPALRNRYQGLGRYVRFRSTDNILSEIEGLQNRYEIRVLNFQDDTFTLRKDWTLNFCESYGARFDYPFWLNTRVEHLDEEMIQVLAEAGCQRVRIGVESGNEALRKRILKREMSNKDFRQAFELLHQYGIETYTCNMIGIPGETLDMIQETIDLNRELAPTKFQFSVFYPYPMTELGDMCVEEGYLDAQQETLGYYDRQSTLTLPSLSPADLERGYDRFEELRYELALKKNPKKYQLYRLARKLFGDDIGRWRQRLMGIRKKFEVEDEE